MSGPSEYLKLRYMAGDCKCGDCQLVPPQKLREWQAELDGLRAAVARIDSMNDNPACYNAEINAVCDTILRPALGRR